MGDSDTIAVGRDAMTTLPFGGVDRDREGMRRGTGVAVDAGFVVVVPAEVAELQAAEHLA